MKYLVNVTETLEKAVAVDARDMEEAERIARMLWEKEEIVLGADDFTGVEFRAVAARMG